MASKGERVAIESPIAQWLEHPTRSRRVVGSNPMWGSDFFRVPSGFYQHLISHVYISFSHSLTWALLVKKGKIHVLHLQHEFPCISLSYSTKQQRQITIF